jgi:rod shape-determining protein MreD
MKNVLEAGIGIVVAVVFYSLLGKISAAGAMSFNIFILVVIYFAQIHGEVFGAVVGTACGLIFDSLSIGIFGIAGLSATITGFLAGMVSSRIHVVPFLRNLAFLFVMVVFHLALWVLLVSFILSDRTSFNRGSLLLQPVVTAGLGGLIFLFLRKLRKRLGH